MKNLKSYLHFLNIISTVYQYKIIGFVLEFLIVLEKEKLDRQLILLLKSVDFCVIKVKKEYCFANMSLRKHWNT